VGALIRLPKQADMQAPVKRALCRNLLKSRTSLKTFIFREALLFNFKSTRLLLLSPSKEKRSRLKKSKCKMTIKNFKILHCDFV
jgi:hypothetical protein